MPKAQKLSMLDHAVQYAKLGLPVIPLHGILPDGSCTCGRAACSSPGKHPRNANGLKGATTDPKQIERWWSDRQWPNASIGGVGGAFLCLDIDARKGGFDTLQRLIASNSKLPDTAIAETGEYDGERGKHYWFKVPEDVDPPGSRANVREGIDIRCAGGYAVMPPSPHASGVDYEWISRKTLKGAAELPAWLLDLAPEYVAGESSWTPDPNFKLSKEVSGFLRGDWAPEIGEQRDFLPRAARAVLTTGRSVELAASLLWEGYDGEGGIQSAEWDAEPWTPEDIYAIVADIYVKPPSTPMEKDFKSENYTLDDAGNAQRLIASFQPEHVHFCRELDKWFIWDVQRELYFLDGGDWMSGRWLAITEQLLTDAANARSEGEGKVLYKHAKESRQRWRVDNAITMAERISKVHERELDGDPMLFGVANGVIDLRDGDLYESEPEQLITKRSAVEYDPGATSKVFDEFMKRTVPDPELRDFMRRACGYTLTGATSEHAFFYIYGRPASGKTTFLEAFRKVLGTYSAVADSSTFLREGSRNGHGPSEDLARLAGARMVATYEIEEGQRLAVSLIARLTGGDPVAARFLNRSTFEFVPRFKLWMGANHLPRAAGGVRSGLWRRVKIIEMDEPIDKADRDPTLPVALCEPEAQAAILAWAVTGAVDWHEHQAEGKLLQEPKAVTKAVESFEREQDHIAQFMADAIEQTGNDTDRVPAADLFEHYQEWCDLQGRQRRSTKNQVGRVLSDHGFYSKQAAHEGTSKRCWMGVQLIPLEGDHGITIKGATKK